MVLEEVSAGSAATALARVLYSPDVVVPARTTRAPDGGVVREVGGDNASAESARAKPENTKRPSILRPRLGSVEAHTYEYLYDGTKSVTGRGVWMRSIMRHVWRSVERGK